MKNLKVKFEALISDWELAGLKRMFGYDVYAANRKMFAWLEEDGISLTGLAEPDRIIVTEQFGAHPYTALDRVFKSWLIIPVPNETTFKKLIPYIRKSYEGSYAASLAPKPPRRSYKKKRIF